MPAASLDCWRQRLAEPEFRAADPHEDASHRGAADLLGESEDLIRRQRM